VDYKNKMVKDTTMEVMLFKRAKSLQSPLRIRAYQAIFLCPFSQECTYRQNNKAVV
jgi:hypothetical protein